MVHSVGTCLSRLNLDFLEGQFVNFVDSIFSQEPQTNSNPYEYVDGIGIKWNKGMWPGSFPDSDYTFDLEKGDGFRAGHAEWFGVLLAAFLAQKDSRVPTLVELGSSQGLWCANWIRIFQISPHSLQLVHAHGYEAAESFIETSEFWHGNFQNINKLIEENGLTLVGDNWIFRQHRKAVSKNGKHMLFPKVEIAKDNGAQAIVRSKNNMDYRGKRVEYETVKGISILEILRSVEHLSILHLDLQGLEWEVIKGLDIRDLSKKVRVIVVGTHSLGNHLKLKQKLNRFFTLACEEKPRFIRDSYRKVLAEDGTLTFLSKESNLG